MLSFNDYSITDLVEAPKPTNPAEARLSQLEAAMEAQRKKMLEAEARAEAEEKLFYQRQNEYRQAKRQTEMDRPLKKFRQLPQSGLRLTVVSPTQYRLGPPVNPVIEISHDPAHGWRWYGVTSYKKLNQYVGAWYRDKEDAIRDLDTALANADGIAGLSNLPYLNRGSLRLVTRK